MATQELLFELEEKKPKIEEHFIAPQLAPQPEAEDDEEQDDEDEDENLLPIQKEYKGYSAKTLCDAPDQTLFELLQMCHPDCRHRASHGKTEAYDIGRGDVLCAIQKRGDRILCDLGYPTKLESVYVNKYTGSRYTYAQLTDRRKVSTGNWDEDRVNQSENWSVLEHWLPEGKADPKILLNCLKETLAQLTKEKNPCGGKAEHKKKIKQAELDVRLEEIKVFALENS